MSTNTAPNSEPAHQHTPSTTERTVTIPACDEHDGFLSVQVTLLWICPTCGGPRGEPYATHSFDGSRRLGVHGWKNPCSHVDKYSSCREEASRNQRNRSC